MVAQVVREAALPATILMTRHGTAGYYRVRRSHPSATTTLGNDEAPVASVCPAPPMTNLAAGSILHLTPRQCINARVFFARTCFHFA